MLICLFINLSGCPGLSCSMWALHCGMWDAGIPSSVQFSHSVVPDSLRPRESLHARPPCPSPTPGVHSDSRPSSQWCHPAISSSVSPRRMNVVIVWFLITASCQVKSESTWRNKCHKNIILEYEWNIPASQFTCTFFSYLIISLLTATLTSYWDIYKKYLLWILHLWFSK